MAKPNPKPIVIPVGLIRIVQRIKKHPKIKSPRRASPLDHLIRKYAEIQIMLINKDSA